MSDIHLIEKSRSNLSAKICVAKDFSPQVPNDELTVI